MAYHVAEDIADQVEAKQDYYIRWMIRRDIPDILAIEKEVYGDFAWDEDRFLCCLRSHNCIGMVVDIHPEWIHPLRGYMIFELNKEFLHIATLAVNPIYRRQGVGASMLAKLAGKLTHHRRTYMTAAVSERFLGAHLFLRDFGFRATGIEHGLGRGGEDEYVFRYDHRQ